MRKMIATVSALFVALVVSLTAAAPAQASTGYLSRSCYVGSLRMTVNSWINSNGTKTYHGSASQISGSYPWRRAEDADARKYFYDREWYYTTSNTSRDLWYGEWLHNGYVVACTLTV